MTTLRVAHYRRPAEGTFTAGERDQTTILVGGLTERTERLIVAGFRGCGFRCERLPTPDGEAFLIGKEMGNPGQCNPAYFTVGSLIAFLRSLEATGIPRHDIVSRYAFFTAGSCGPCRFGMYESEYRLALENAGFGGFRVLLFQQASAFNQSEPYGLQFTFDFVVRMLLALQLGDVLNDMAFQLRPYETTPGETNRVMDECLEDLCATLLDRDPVDVQAVLPAALLRFHWTRKPLVRRLLLVHRRMYSGWIARPLERCRARIAAVDIDRTRVKPVVKIAGEFWAQTTEGDGNYRMFDFLEREGAEVRSDPIGGWVTYLLSQAAITARRRHELARLAAPEASWRARSTRRLRLHRTLALLWIGERLFVHFYARFRRALGGLAHDLAPQRELARLAAPFYSPLARGGEGHLEVGKNIYYTRKGLCHAVLSLKPFGCMPSSQSDGVQAAVIRRHPGMIFLPIETSGDGEINALGRVQMALGDARRKARREFDEALASTGKSLDEIHAWMARAQSLRRALPPVRRRSGVAGTAANFVLDLDSWSRRP